MLFEILSISLIIFFFTWFKSPSRLFEIKETPKVKQFRLAFDLPFSKKTMRFIWQFYRTPDTWTFGMTSRCKDGKHVLFFDYDKDDYAGIKDEIQYLQKFYHLSSAYVFENDKDKSYHVVILDKFPLKKAYKILSNSNVEWSYTNSVKMIRGHEWVLRTGEKGKRKKPQYVAIIKSKYDVREVSTAHKRFIQQYYGVHKIVYRHEDRCKIIPMVNYNTGNRVE